MSKDFITTTAPECLLRASIAGFLVALVSSCDSGSGASDDQPPEDTGLPRLVSVGSPVTDSLGQNMSRVYRVPPDTEIILTTENGDADIYLHEAEDLTEDTALCVARRPFNEDICTASSTSGLLYATVFGYEASTYTISATNDCSTESINRWVYRSMQDYYLFADQVPTVNPGSYDDPSELIKVLRNDTADPYSSVDDAQSRQAFFDEGIAFGFGYGLIRDAEDNPVISYVYNDSVFGRSGVKRGDIIARIGGVSVDLMTNDIFNSLVGTDSNPLTVEWEFIDGDTGQRKTIEAAKSEYRLNTVLYSNHYTVEGFSGRIGYLVFNRFLRISEGELDSAIGELAQAGITELVLDLRYNGGGYTYIANRLAAQIAGPSLNGERAVSYQYNSKYTDQNNDRYFEAAEPSLNLSRLVVLTAGGTASSSELLINSLRPYMEVITVGERTEGKAFISSGSNFCGKVINAMEAQGVNANGVSVVGGIPADCFASDDLSRNFGAQSNAVEGMLQSALNYVSSGTCNVAPMVAASRSRGKVLPYIEMPIVGAFDDSRKVLQPGDQVRR